MKKLLILVLFVLLLFFNLISGEKELVEEINQLYNQKNFNKALELIEKGLKDHKDSSKLQRLKFYVLIELKRYDEALVVVEKSTTNPDQQKSARLYIYKLQGKYQEALKIAIEKEKTAKRKSPWNCFELIELYLKLKNKEKAMDWLDEAVNRGFNSYMYLYEKDFALIQGEERFKKAIQKIKDNIGLEKTAKNFSVDLLSGKKFTLSEQKGKVVLVDFWATWCRPCREGIPALKQYYRELNPKGFEIIGISLDNSIEPLNEYIKNENLKWKISFSGKGWNDETAKLYGVNSIPSYWLIDKKGILRYFGLSKDKLKKAVEELLAE
jgi:thiol-disulfide isomerase/thioredoxin